MTAEILKPSETTTPSYLRSSCPIHKLPAETLGCIFEHVANSLHINTTADLEDITGEVYAEPQAIRNYQDALPNSVGLWFPITRVCRNWHDVAFLTPSLWAAIMIGPWDPLPLDRFAKQLDLSKNAPIDFLLDSCRDARPDYPTLCGLLRPHAHRWRSLEVRSDWIMDMNTVLDAFFTNRVQIAPQLTSVTLVCDNMSYLPASFGLSAPHLQTIRILGITVDWNQPWISSASNLTTLHLGIDDSPSWTQFATLLRGTPLLKVLILQTAWLKCTWADTNLGRISDDHHMNPIKLLELNQLVISLPSAMAIHLLRRCYIPGLRKLTLRSHPQNLNLEFEALVAQLVAPEAVTDTPPMQVRLPGTQEQSQNVLAGLDYLCLHCCSSECIRLLYSILYNLTTLVLQIDPGRHASIDLLFRPSISCAILLPQLKTLSVHSHKMYRERDAVSVVALARHRHEIGVLLSALLLRSVRRDTEIKQDPDWLWCSDSKNLETFYFEEL